MKPLLLLLFLTTTFFTSLLTMMLTFTWAYQMPGPYGRGIIFCLAVAASCWLGHGLVAMLRSQIVYTRKYPSEPIKTLLGFSGLSLAVLAVVFCAYMTEIGREKEVGEFVLWLIHQ